jgi:hypothetical protein
MFTDARKEMDAHRDAIAERVQGEIYQFNEAMGMPDRVLQIVDSSITLFWEHLKNRCEEDNDFKVFVTTEEWDDIRKEAEDAIKRPGKVADREG